MRKHQPLWAIFGRVVGVDPGNAWTVGAIHRIGLRTFTTKQDARTAKHEMIRNQEPTSPVRFRYFARKVPG